MADVIDLFRHIKSRPSLYMHPVKYSSAVALLAGYDLATDSLFLQGFCEWLVLKLGYRCNFYWGRIIPMIAFPEAPLDIFVENKLSNEQEEIAITTLFDELEEFYLVKKDSTKGLRWIYAQYEHIIVH